MLFLKFLLSCHIPIILEYLFNVNGAGYQNRTGDPTLAKLRFTIKLILRGRGYWDRTSDDRVKVCSVTATLTPNKSGGDNWI